MAYYYLETHAHMLSAQDWDEALAQAHTWVKRNARSGELYWLNDPEDDQKIHALELATNPLQVMDPVYSTGRYVHNNGDGTFSGWRDGYEQRSYEAHESYEAAAETLFPSWAGGGYNALYYPLDAQDQIVTGPWCNECALNAFIEDGTQFQVENDDGEERYLDDITCSACGDVITPRICADCGTDLDPETARSDDERWQRTSLPVFRQENGCALHGTCLAKFVAKGETSKISLLSYAFRPDSGLSGTGHWWGVAPFSAAYVRAGR